MPIHHPQPRSQPPPSSNTKGELQATSHVVPSCETHNKIHLPFLCVCSQWPSPPTILTLPDDPAMSPRERAMEKHWCSAQSGTQSPAKQNPIFHNPPPHLSRNPILISLVSFLSTAAAKSLQLCPTLCDSIDGSPPGSRVPGILQARTLKWVASFFSNA